MQQSVDPRPDCLALGYGRWVSRRSEQLSDALQEYVEAHSTPPDEILTELAEQTERMFGSDAGMQIGPDQGTFMTLLARLVGAARAVELGTFTGYPAICVARGLTDRSPLLSYAVSGDR